jgi:hypothetical protein
MKSNKDIKEFIDADGDMISGDKKYIDYTATTHDTTDATILKTRQPFVFQNYRRYYGEATLPFNKEADKCKDDPEKFHKFLYEKGMEHTFEDYFLEAKPRMKDVKPADPKDKLKEIAKEKAFKMLETLLAKRNESDKLITKQLPTIEEIKDKENLILGKFDQLIEFFNQNMSEDEKKVLLDYFQKSLTNA